MKHRLKRLGRWFAALLASLAAAGCTPLTAFNALVAKDPGAALVAGNIPYGPDPRQRLDVYRPLGARPDGRLPVIVFFYGGSWNSGTKTGYGFVGRALAAQGFLVVIPDYRLVPKVRYPAFIEDGAAAIGWVSGHASSLGGDPARLVLAGHSAGAYNAAMLGYGHFLRPPQKRQIRGFIGLAGPYDFLPFTGSVTREAFLGTADLTATQPVNMVTPGSPPAFLATGAGDRTVEPRNSDALARALRNAGIRVARRVYPGIGHIGILTAIARPLRSRAPVLNEMVAFARQVTESPLLTGTIGQAHSQRGEQSCRN